MNDYKKAVIIVESKKSLTSSNFQGLGDKGSAPVSPPPAQPSQAPQTSTATDSQSKK
jgi:hypothetical protein